MTLNAERAMEKALEVAQKAGLPMTLVEVVQAKRTGEHWEVLIAYYTFEGVRKFRALIDAETGDVVEWSEVEPMGLG